MQPALQVGVVEPPHDDAVRVRQLRDRPVESVEDLVLAVRSQQGCEVSHTSVMFPRGTFLSPYSYGQHVGGVGCTMNRWNAFGEHGAGSTCRSASFKVGSTAGTVSVEEVRGTEGVR